MLIPVAVTVDVQTSVENDGMFAAADAETMHLCVCVCTSVV